MSSTEERKVRALESISKEVSKLTAALNATHDRLVEIGKIIQEKEGQE